MKIVTKSYPRAALIGNPSDGYFGKTIAFVFKDFEASISLEESEYLEILPQERDRTIFKNLEDLVDDIKDFGYYGGLRLIKASLKKFSHHCIENQIAIASKNFKIAYHSTIPNRLGLAGSSAIITACMKALMEFYQVSIPKAMLANLILSVETEELNISAGLQDRVAQSFEEPVFMDFDKKIMKKQGYGHYETFEATLLFNLYIAFRKDLSEGSEVVHDDLKARFEKGDSKVLAAMQKFAALTVQAKLAIENNNLAKLSDLMNQNFDLRASICNISTNNGKMIAAARSAGASAKFTGSGGAIIGIYENENMFEALKMKMKEIGAELIKPNIL